MEYYPSHNDENWNREIEAIMPYIPTKSETDTPEKEIKIVDIGCGDRTINSEIITVDIDDTRKPQIIAHAENLPFKDNSLDGIVSVHSFEHFKDQELVLSHWIQKLKNGGIIAMVHPDKDWTHQKEVKGYDGKRKEYYKHEHERNLQEFLEYINTIEKVDWDVIASGSALGHYSFFVIIKKSCLP